MMLKLVQQLLNSLSSKLIGGIAVLKGTFVMSVLASLVAAILISFGSPLEHFSSQEATSTELFPTYKIKGPTVEESLKLTSGESSCISYALDFRYGSPEARKAAIACMNAILAVESDPKTRSLLLTMLGELDLHYAQYPQAIEKLEEARRIASENDAAGYFLLRAYREELYQLTESQDDLDRERVREISREIQELEDDLGPDFESPKEFEFSWLEPEVPFLSAEEGISMTGPAAVDSGAAVARAGDADTAGRLRLLAVGFGGHDGTATATFGETAFARLDHAHTDALRVAASFNDQGYESRVRVDGDILHLASHAAIGTPGDFDARLAEARHLAVGDTGTIVSRVEITDRSTQYLDDPGSRGAARRVDASCGLHQDANNGTSNKEIYNGCVEGDVTNTAAVDATTGVGDMNLDIEVYDANRRRHLLDDLWAEVLTSRPGDRFLFYFSGHGFLAPDGRRTLVTAAGPDGVEALALDEVGAVLSHHRGDVTVIVDACAKPVDLDPGSVPLPPPFPPGVGKPTFILAGSPGEIAVESTGLGAGLYTHTLLEYLESEADDEVLNWDEVFDYSARETSRLAWLRYQVEQTPQRIVELRAVD